LLGSRVSGAFRRVRPAATRSRRRRRGPEAARDDAL